MARHLPDQVTALLQDLDGGSRIQSPKIFMVKSVRSNHEAVGCQPSDVCLSHRQGIVKSESAVMLKGRSVHHMTDRNEEGRRDAEIPQILDGPRVIAIAIVE